MPRDQSCGAFAGTREPRDTAQQIGEHPVHDRCHFGLSKCQTLIRILSPYLTNGVQESGPETLREELSLHLEQQVRVVRVVLAEYVAHGPQRLIAHLLHKSRGQYCFVNRSFTEHSLSCPALSTAARTAWHSTSARPALLFRSPDLQRVSECKSMSHTHIMAIYGVYIKRSNSTHWSDTTRLRV
jgi:hypothetical protein